ncbi:1129_t:CDS:2, partial [Paraglomus occultum]
KRDQECRDLILVAAVQNPVTGKYVLTNKPGNSSTQQSNSSGYPFPSPQPSASSPQSYAYPQSSASLQSSSSPQLSSPSFYPRIEAGIRPTEEEKLARKQVKKQQPAEMRNMRTLDAPNITSENDNGFEQPTPGQFLVFQDVPSDVGRRTWEYYEVDGLN